MQSIYTYSREKSIYVSSRHLPLVTNLCMCAQYTNRAEHRNFLIHEILKTIKLHLHFCAILIMMHVKINIFIH